MNLKSSFYNAAVEKADKSHLIDSDVVNTRLASLDGLRAIAIILVLLYHLMPGRNSDQGIVSLIFKIADIGWIGVDLFFVISGFLITSILLNGIKKSRSLSRYMINRLLRIVPAYFSALILIFLIVPAISYIYDFPPLSEQLVYWLYVPNYFFLDSLTFSEYFHLGHFWSLGVEMQFYLIWPIVLVTFGQHRNLPYFIISTIFFFVILKGVLVVSGSPWYVTYAFLPFRMDGLLIGSLVAILISRKLLLPIQQNNFLNMFLIVLILPIIYVAWFHLGSAVFRQPWNFTVFSVRTFFPLVCCLFFGLLLVKSLQPSLLSKFLSLEPFGIIAKYSYGLYIIHYLTAPMFERTLLPALRDYFGVGDLSVYIYFLVTATFSFILAMLSFHLIENPFLSLKKQF